jgi:diguanylate cyclase (GGDEF)-like protein
VGGLGLGRRAQDVANMGVHSVTRASDWRSVVRIVTILATIVLGWAVVDVVLGGLTDPRVVLVGLTATAVVNRVYVVMARHGQVLEAIDIAEAPLVVLCLLLPPGEAVLTFVLASAVMEVRLDRARIKKVFNIGIRAVGAALCVLTVVLLGSVPGAAVGALAYGIFTAVAIALVVASVQDRPVRSVLRDGLGSRMAVWILATTVGLASAELIRNDPMALVGILAALVLLSMSAQAAERMQRENERDQHLLAASTRIQSAEAIDEQEEVLVEVARDVLMWKDVEVRDRPPGGDERGRQLPSDNGERWLVVARQPGSDPWLADDDSVVDFLARSASVAYERSTVREDLTRQALLDPLTGVGNRRHFDDEIRRLSIARRGYGIVVCDLDHFKTINDRLGHETGDDLLRIAAARLSTSVRAGDLVARLGGDEFVVLLPGVTSREALQRVYDTIAAKFEQRVKVGRWQLSALPCSFGVAVAPTDGRTPREVMRAADESMYDAKHRRKSLRHRVTVTLPEATVDLGQLASASSR